MIKVAIIGGGIGGEHLAAYRAVPEFQVTLIVDRDEDRRMRLCGSFIKSSSEIEDALQSDVDVIDICLPPDLHVEVALRALKAGKHVICEKPIATSLADMDRLLEAKEQAQKRLFPVFQYRYGPAFSKLQALIDAGLTGAPRAASLETHWSRAADYYDVDWRGTWAHEKGGAILCHAIHSHDLLARFMAPIENVHAKLATLINPIETEDSAALSFQLKGGALATSSVTLGAAQDESRIRLVYEKLTATSGSLPYSPALSGWTFTARDAEDQAAVDDCVKKAPKMRAGFEGFFGEVAKALNGQDNSAVSMAEGRASIELTTAIYASDRSGHSQSLPIQSDHALYAGWQPK